MAKLWVLYLGSLPLLVLPFTKESFALHKFLFLVLVCLHGLSFLNKDGLVWKPNAIDRLALAFILIRWVSALFCPLPLMYSLETLCFETCLFLGYLVLRLEPLSKEDFLWIAKSLILWQSLLVILQCSGVEWIKPLVQTRATAQYFHPNLLGIYSLVCGIYCLQQKEPRFFWLSLIGLFTSHCRLAVLLLILICPLTKKLRPMTCIGLSVLSLFWFIYLEKTSGIEGYRLLTEPTLQIKKAVLLTSLDAIRQNPLGLGPGLYEGRIHTFVHADLHYYFPQPEQNLMQKAHNFPLEMIAESGYLMAIWFVLFIPCFICFRSSVFFLPCLILLLTSLFDLHLNYPTSQILLLPLLAGLQSATNAITKAFPTHLLLISFFCLPYAIAYLSKEIQMHSWLKQLRNNYPFPIIEKTHSLLVQNPLPLYEAQIRYLNFLYLVQSEKWEPALPLGLGLQENFAGFYELEYHLALIYFYAQTYDQALFFVEKAIDFHPMDEDNYFLKARIQKASKDEIGAAESLVTGKALKKRNFNFRDQVPN